MKRRSLFALTLLPLLHAMPALAATAVEVYKTPSCGCCANWVKHLSAAGFTVRVNDVEDTGPIRQKLGMPEQFAGCHTAIVGSYVIEGHVPAADIRQLLASKPAALGLSVPGMVVGSPGMEMGSRKEPYQVLLVQRSGQSSVFSAYNQPRKDV
jgi:hypothetical protein